MVADSITRMPIKVFSHPLVVEFSHSKEVHIERQSYSKI